MPGASGLAHLARRREGLQVKQLCRDAETDFGQNSYARTQEWISGKAAMPGRRNGFRAKQLCRDTGTDFGKSSYARTQKRISCKTAMPGHRNGFRAKQLCQDTSAVLRQSFHAWIREWSWRRDKNVVPVWSGGQYHMNQEFAGFWFTWLRFACWNRFWPIKCSGFIRRTDGKYSRKGEVSK